MIDIQKLTFSYKNKNSIFKDFNFAPQSRFTIIKGPSGCGKTTLLKLLTGDLHPQSAVGLPNAEKKALILQEDALFPWMTGMQNILKIVPVSEEVVKAHSLYQHIASYIERPAHEMSYGQRRMIELFRVILYKPTLLALDEPFNFLDPKNRKHFLDYLLLESGNLSESTIVMSTHYSEDTSGLGLESFYFDGAFPVTKLLTEHEFQESV